MTLMATAKKAAATAARPKKTTVPRQKAAPVSNAVEAPKAPKTKAITLGGREIEVRRPTTEQILAWEESMGGIAKLDTAAIDFEKMRAAVDTFYEITGDLFIHDADREWLATARRRGIVSFENPDMRGAVADISEWYKEEMDEAAKANMSRAQKRAAARKK